MQQGLEADLIVNAGWGASSSGWKNRNLTLITHGAKGCTRGDNDTSTSGVSMAIALKLSNELVEDAKSHAAAEHRSVPKQIEYWARIGKTVLENPEMPLRLIQDTILSREEVKAGLATTYQVG